MEEWGFLTGDTERCARQRVIRMVVVGCCPSITSGCLYCSPTVSLMLQAPWDCRYIPRPLLRCATLAGIAVSSGASSQGACQLCVPAAENRGIFWPRAMEFITSMVEIPVWIISSG